MTTAEKGRKGVINYLQFAQKNSRDFADKEGGKYPELCGRHIWKPPFSGNGPVLD